MIFGQLWALCIVVMLHNLRFVSKHVAVVSALVHDCTLKIKLVTECVCELQLLHKMQSGSVQQSSRIEDHKPALPDPSGSAHLSSPKRPPAKGKRGRPRNQHQHSTQLIATKCQKQASAKVTD